MINAILDIKSQPKTSESPRERVRLALEASKRLQSDGRVSGYDRVDIYYEDVEGDWLEDWQESK